MPILFVESYKYNEIGNTKCKAYLSLCKLLLSLCRHQLTFSKIDHTQKLKIMSYQVKENIINIFSGLLISSIYAVIIYQRHMEGRFDLTEDFKAWGVIFLIFMGVSIVARIILYIVFHIISAIATQKEPDIPVSDERDKLITLKATRNSHHAFSISIALAFVLLAFGMPVYGIFIAFLVGGLLSEIIDNGSQIYYRSKGI